MLSFKKVLKLIDIMVNNLYSFPDYLDSRITEFQHWLSLSFISGLIDGEYYTEIRNYGYEKIKNMEDYV